MKRLSVFGMVLVSLTVALWTLLPRPSPPEGGQGASVSSPTATTPVRVSPAATTPAASGSNAATPAAFQIGPRAPVPTATVASAPVQTAVLRKRPWDTNFLASLRPAVQNDPIRFELVGGEWAAGTIRYLQHQNGELIHVAGQLTAPESGRFFFQKQTRPGVAGDFVGVVEFSVSEKAFRIEPTGPNQSPELVEHALGNVVCLRLPPATNLTEQIPPLRPDQFPNVPIPPYQSNIIVLESLPGATPVLYLDYQGGYTPTWGGIAYDRPNVNNADIRDVWKRVAEDYMPFNINVTTDLKVFRNAPVGSRQRVIVTPTKTAAPSAGGVAYIGSFDWTGDPDTPCWVFMTTGKSCAEAASHEAGHTFGLSHDGQDVGGVHTEYYGGQGSGAVGWAPIMGVGYYQPVSQWSKGEYANANNTEDDIAIISGKNNSVAYRADDTGATLATARYLEVYANGPALAEGVIERTADTDAFEFTTTGGAMSLRADPVGDWGNLAISLTLRNASDQVIASNNPQSTLYAAVTTNLLAGTYTICVTGAGRNTPLTDGFSAYASLGYYTVTGMVAGARLPARFAIGESPTNGTAVGTIPAVNPGGNPLTYTIVSGNTSNAFTVNNSGNLIVANSNALSYEVLARYTQLAVQFEMFVNITNTLNSAQTELNRRVLVVITNLNEPPSLAGFSTSVLEHTQPGTAVGTLTGSDPDFYTLLAYSILAGNSNNMFTVDTNSGVISVAGDLNTAIQTNYTIKVMVSDQTLPTPLMATSTVVITVLTNRTPFQPGTLAYAVYDNINGTAVSALTSAAAFPRDPTWEKQVTLFEGDTGRADNYGAALRGYLIPAASGFYTFWIASDDNSELRLSTTTNPASAIVIASVGDWTNPRQWTKFSSQQSALVSLARGQAYYIEARMKEGSGGDNVAVAWQCLSNGISQDVIPGKYLAPFPMNYVPHGVGFATSLHKDAVAGAHVGIVGMTDVNTNDAHTFVIRSGNTEGIFSMDATNGILRVASDTALQSATRSSYSLQIVVTDNGAPPLSGTNTVTINIVAPTAITVSAIQQEVWNNIGGGTAVSDLTGNARYPKRPDTLRPLTTFDSGQNYGDNYGSRTRAYLTPTTSGSYTFFIASDDASQLLFGANPASASGIASVSGYTGYQAWTQYSSQQSAARSLVAGQAYYIEALQKEGGGGDFVSVAWSGPGLSGTNVIDGAFLTPVDLNYPPDLSGATVRTPNTLQNGAYVTNLTATDSSLDSISYKIVSGNLSNTFALDPDTGTLTVSNNTALANLLVSAFSLTVQAQDSGYGGRYPLKSTQAVVNVQVVETFTPFVWSGGGPNSNWSTGLNWNGTAPTNNSRLVFTGSVRLTNANDFLTHVAQVVFNNGGFRVSGLPVGMDGGITSTGTNTWAIPTTLSRPQTFTSASGQLNLAGPVTNNGNLLTLVASNVLHLDGPVCGAGGLTKVGSSLLTISSTNTYTGDTRVTQGGLSLVGFASVATSANLILESNTTLVVSGLTNSFSLAAGQTLRGIGNVSGSVTVLPGATISPGSTGPGMLLLSGALGLSGTVQLELNKGTVPSNDVIRAFGALIYGGALVVSNLSAVPLVVGDKFRCFYAGSYNGAFASLTLPPLGAGLGWDTSRLTVDGSFLVAVAPILAVTTPIATSINIPSGVGLVLGASASSTHNPNGLTFAWTQLGGPGTVAFGNAGSTNATALFPAIGSYTLGFTASDGPVQATTNLTVNVGFVPVPVTNPNVGPWVSAGSDLTISSGTAALTGSFSDDGAPFPPGVTTVIWSKLSGPGDVTIFQANAPQATATFSAPGTYTLRLTADDGQVKTFDDMSITNAPFVLPAPPQISGFGGGADGVFRFHLASSDPTNYTVMVSTNVQDWSILGAAALSTNGWFQFTDPAAFGAPQRLYRLRWP